MSDNIMVNGIEMDSEEISRYFDGLIGKVFAILGVYEDCTELKNYDVFDSYVYRVICELRGFYKLTNSTSFISVSSILEDLHTTVMEDSDKEENEQKITHKRVKSLVFHCISIIKKEKVV